GKNEDRSIFASDNQNNHRRLLGVNPDNSDSRTLVSDINATLNTWPLCNSSFGGPHPGVCMFAMGDGSIKPIKTSVDVTTLTRLAVDERPHHERAVLLDLADRLELRVGDRLQPDVPADQLLQVPVLEHHLAADRVALGALVLPLAAGGQHRQPEPEQGG